MGKSAILVERPKSARKKGKKNRKHKRNFRRSGKLRYTASRRWESNRVQKLTNHFYSLALAYASKQNLRNHRDPEARKKVKEKIYRKVNAGRLTKWLDVRDDIVKPFC